MDKMHMAMGAMKDFAKSRRGFLKTTSAMAGAFLLCPRGILARTEEPIQHNEPAVPPSESAVADYTLRIATSPVEIAPKRIISITTYNGQFPGPLIRFKEGQQVTVDVFNDTDTPEQLHWHGQKIPTDMAMDFLSPSTRVNSLEDTGESAMKASIAKGMPHGYEVGYGSFTINGRMLGHGEPIRVKQGERVLFHILNGSATEIRSLALPGHSFQVVALDGNPVPNPMQVPVLWLGTAERISAIVEMNHPGVWIMGDLADDDRRHGMGIVVEYAEHKGKPVWTPAQPFHWTYERFANRNGTPATPDEV